jgi:uncharacterized protein (DUF58 family)
LKSSKERIYIVPTRYGFLYGIVLFFLVSLATVFNSTECLIASAILVTFGVMCMHQTHTNIAQLAIRAVESQSGFAKEKIFFRLEIINKGPTTSFSINIFEDVIDIPAREKSTQSLAIQPSPRGRYSLDTIKISSTYPLGLFYSWKWHDVDLLYYVYPALGISENFLLHSNNSHSDLESRDDFIGHRDYVVGDSAHHIDWKAQARKQKLLIKLFESTSTEASLFNWNKVPGGDTEEKLSLLSRAIFECYKVQKPFGLIMPDINLPVESSQAHYESALKILATFSESKNEAS